MLGGVKKSSLSLSMCGAYSGSLPLFSRIIVTKKGLRKGTGYHWDLFLIGLLGTVCGLFGFPFLSAATVRTVAHVSSLSVFSRTDAPGVKPKLLQVTEQRVTSLCVHIMIGKWRHLYPSYGPSASERPLGTIREEKGIASQFVFLYDLS